MKWISVKESLPTDKGRPVLTYDSFYGYNVGQWTGNEWVYLAHNPPARFPKNVLWWAEFDCIPKP